MRATNDQAVHRDLLRRCSAMMMSIRALPQPVIAKVHAIATAAGCQLVAACDLAVASSTATFGTHGVNNGLFCGTPSVPLGRNIGSKRALDMLLGGEEIDAETALRDGLVSRVVAPDQLDAETMRLAHRIAGQSPLAVSGGKAMFHRHMEMNLTEAYAFATEYMAQALASQDARDGIDAFIGKRPAPDWKGR
jgi:enoyl-CoA hydratase/carnithine racemase